MKIFYILTEFDYIYYTVINVSPFFILVLVFIYYEPILLNRHTFLIGVSSWRISVQYPSLFMVIYLILMCILNTGIVALIELICYACIFILLLSTFMLLYSSYHMISVQLGLVFLYSLKNLCLLIIILIHFIYCDYFVGFKPMILLFLYTLFSVPLLLLSYHHFI